jgi:hypothetical protein
MVRRGSHRRWVAAVATLAVVVSAAGLWWFLWVPNRRPALRVGESYGIDVSAHQGSIDWRAVADDGIGFAYVKATEGGDHTDSRFRRNWDGAEAARLERGAYHFFTLCTSGAAQARHFLQIVPPEAGALAPAVDLELAGNCRARPTRTEVAGQLESFLGEVARLGPGRCPLRRRRLGGCVPQSLILDAAAVASEAVLTTRRIRLGHLAGPWSRSCRRHPVGRRPRRSPIQRPLSSGGRAGPTTRVRPVLLGMRRFGQQFASASMPRSTTASGSWGSDAGPSG